MAALNPRYRRLTARGVTAAVRPEYRLSVLVPPGDNRLFNNGPCQVTGCRHTAWSRRDLCGTHTIRWFHARQAGADRVSGSRPPPRSPLRSRASSTAATSAGPGTVSAARTAGDGPATSLPVPRLTGPAQLHLCR